MNGVILYCSYTPLWHVLWCQHQLSSEYDNTVIDIWEGSVASISLW